LRVDDYAVQIEMIKNPPQPGDYVKIDVWLKCPACDQLIWSRAELRFRADTDFVEFGLFLYAKRGNTIIRSPHSHCPLCHKNFNVEGDDEGGLMPRYRQLSEWIKWSRLYLEAELEISTRDIEESWYELTHPYIPPKMRQAEKKGRKRKEQNIWRVSGDFYEY